jgi:hypothetical protein
MSFVCSGAASRRAYAQASERQYPDGRYGRVVTVLNATGAAAFMLGVIFFAFFIFNNLSR